VIAGITAQRSTPTGIRLEQLLNHTQAACGEAVLGSSVRLMSLVREVMLTITGHQSVSGEVRQQIDVAHDQARSW